MIVKKQVSGGRFVMGLDPGFAACGWAIVDVGRLVVGVQGGTLIPRVHEFGVIRTVPLAKKLGIYQADDDFRRATELAFQLDDVFRRWPVRALCAESFAGSKGAKGAAQMGRAWGVLATLRALQWRVPIAAVTPQTLKRVVTARVGKPMAGASKQEVEDAVIASARWSDLAEQQAGALLKADHEHAYDAVGAVLALLDSEVVRAILVA